MMMRGWNAATFGVIMVSLSVVKCNIPFQYHVESPSDPYMVAALREALMNSGISPDGIILKSILWKFEVIRTAYKATYINGKGQSCYMKWRVNFFTGAQAPVMPLCDNLATASGRPGGAVVGPPLVIGGVPGTVCCDQTPQKPGCQPGYRVGCQPGKFPVTTPSSIISVSVPPGVDVDIDWSKDESDEKHRVSKQVHDKKHTIKKINPRG